MKLTGRSPIWEITCAFSKLLMMLASGSASTNCPPKGGFVVPVDLMNVLKCPASSWKLKSPRCAAGSRHSSNRLQTVFVPKMPPRYCAEPLNCATDRRVPAGCAGYVADLLETLPRQRQLGRS